MIPAISLMIGAYTVVRLVEIIFARLDDDERTTLDALLVGLAVVAILIIIFSVYTVFNLADSATDGLSNILN